MRKFTVLQNNPFFTQGRNCTGKIGLSGSQKAAAVMPILSHRSFSGAVDEHLRFVLSKADEFCDSLWKMFQEILKRIFDVADRR